MTGNDFADSAKNVGIVLTSLSGAAYACGYLVVRARGRALGTDPGFALVDQAYVFAGFRFVLILLLALLVTSPLLMVLRWVGRHAGELAPERLCAVETVAAIFAGVATIWVYVATMGVSGVLLSPSLSRLADAALERNQLGTLILLATTALAASMLQWTQAHVARVGAFDAISAVLLLISMLLLALLPLQHGVFSADRNARRLERPPEGARGLASPVWLVDRGTPDRVVLYGLGADGRPRLLTLKADQLDGIAVTGISSLDTAIKERGP